MIRNFTTSADLLKRESELSRVKDTTGMENIIQKAFEDFAIELRESKGSITSNVMLPCYIFTSQSITASYTGVKVSPYDLDKRMNRLVIEKTVTTCTGANTLVLKGSDDGINFLTITTLTLDSTVTQSIKYIASYLHYKVDINVGGVLNMTATVYVVESPFDICVEFLALAYVFESLIKTDDIFIVKSDRYRKLYEDKFANLNYGYDSDLDGVNDQNIEGRSNFDIIEISR